MVPAFKYLITCLSLFFLVDGALFFNDSYAMAQEQVTFYTTYGYRQGDTWVIPMRVWVHERRGAAEKVINRLAASMGSLDARELDNFRDRIQDFVADSQSREKVALSGRFSGWRTATAFIPRPI